MFQYYCKNNEEQKKEKDEKYDERKNTRKVEEVSKGIVCFTLARYVFNDVSSEKNLNII